MRYHYEKPEFYASMYGEIYICDHPVYTRCTLFVIGDKGLSIIQQRYEADTKKTWWSEVDPFSIGKATRFDCDYDECTIDGKPCVDVEDCKYLKTPYTSKTYQEAAMRTADPKLNTEESLLEGLIGLNSEAGEALDIYKKHVFQKHDLDKEKIALELGDALWYLTEAAVALGYSLEDVMEMNIKKLRKRYPYGFDPEKSRNRKD